MSAFDKVCRVDLCLAPSTTKLHVWQIKRFLSWVGKGAVHITRDDIRAYLLRFKDADPNTYANVLKSLKVFFRDFMGMGQAVEGFRFPSRPIVPKTVPNKDQIQRFYSALKTPRDRALFLMYATTGLRQNEVVSLRVEDIDFEKRMVVPKSSGSRTKHTWVSFYNQEAEKALEEYLETRKDSDPRLFPMNRRTAVKIFQRASKETRIHITSQVLREWLAC